MRQRFQYGSLRLKTRQKGEQVWELRYYTGGQRKHATVGTLTEFPSESAVRKSAKVQALLLEANAASPLVGGDVTMGVLIARYERDEMPRGRLPQIPSTSSLKEAACATITVRTRVLVVPCDVNSFVIRTNRTCRRSSYTNREIMTILIWEARKI
jgi:hypothetical protein